MRIKARLLYHPLKFKTPGGTSRGVLKEKDSWFLILESDNNRGIGECSIIEGLSLESHGSAWTILNNLVERINNGEEVPWEMLRDYPAVKMAYETALMDLDSSIAFQIFDSSFLRGGVIPINGLVWMGARSFMLEQIKAKLESGFRCIKIKVAAIDLDEELSLLRYIRSQFSEKEVQIRLDANGGFSADNCLEILKRFSDLGIHSIEQPIRQNQYMEMAYLCSESPIDICLDEELIGLFDEYERITMLKTINPQYVILKPSLLGGFRESDHWIDLADRFKIKWWATSALESNIGLNAIAQWTYTKSNPLYQGLGTGQLFSNNLDSPLMIKDACLMYGKDHWDTRIFDNK